MALNLPQVALIDFRDPRFTGMHLGDGHGLLGVDGEHGAWHWTKMLLALYAHPEQSSTMREPKFCRASFTEAKISLADHGQDHADGQPSAPSLKINVDGENAGITNNIYVKIHRGLFTVFGTGVIEGHPEVDGQATLGQYRCAVFTFLFFVLTIVALLLTGIGYLIYYLASL